MKTLAFLLALSSAAAAQVTGTVQYQDRSYDGTGFTGTTMRPVRRAEIEIARSSDNVVLASGATDLAGSFSLNGIAAGETVFLRIYARRAGGQINAVIRNNSAQGLLYAVATAPITTGPGVSPFGTVNLMIAGGAAPAFNIFDCAVKGFEYLASLEPALPAVPPLLQIYWQSGSTDGTYFERTVNGIFLLGTTSDPDEYDDDIIHHEIGHWIAWRFSRDDTLGGPHTVIDQLDPRTSWSEGFAHFWSAVVRRFVGAEYADPALQVDNFGAGRSVFDIEGPDSPAQAVMATNELAVAAALWDITDAANEPAFDALSGQEPEIWRTLSVRIPIRTDITLEDFHAGLFLEAPSNLAAVNAIFTDRRIRYYADSSEPNDSAGAPTTLPLGLPGITLRTIYGTGDEDWYSVAATPGTLVLETLNLGDGADTMLELYDAAGTTLLASNDDRGPIDPSSLITRVLTVPTTFLARVRRSGTIVEHGYYDLRAQVVINGPPTILSIVASATQGTAPLRVAFSAVVDDADGGSHEYQWDFNGDGRVDWRSFEGATVTTTYDESGTFIAQLRVVDSGDTVVNSPVTITILPSSPATVIFGPTSSGPAPRLVNFNASVSGVIPTAYLWDVDGNGVYESASATTPAFPYTYRTAGTFFPRLLVRDSLGRAVRALAPAITITPGPLPPSIGSFTATNGIIPFASTFSVTHSNLGSSGFVEFDVDGDSRYDYLVPAGGPGGTTFTPEVQRAGDFVPRVRVTDSAGRAVFTTSTYTSRSIGLTGWMVDPRAGDRLAGSSVTLTAQAVPAGLSKSVQFQVRDGLGGGPWIDVGAPIVSPGSLFSTTWDVSGLADLLTFDVRILIDGTVSSGDTANTVVIDSALPTVSESGPVRTKTVRTDRTTISRSAQNVWAIVPLGATQDGLPMTLEPAAIPGANGSALGMIPSGSGLRVTFGGTFQNTWRLRLPGAGTDLEIHHFDEPSTTWQRLAFARVSQGDGWVEAEVNAPGVYALFSPVSSRKSRGGCGATGLEAAVLLLLLRRRRC